LIKIPAEQLFAFNEIQLDGTVIDGVRDEAAFFFTQLTTLRIKDKKNTDTLQAKKIIEEFQKIGQLKLISLDFQYRHCPDLEIMGEELLAKINRLRFYGIQLHRQCLTDKESHLDQLDNIVLKNDEKNACDRFMPGATAWSALTELVLQDCDLSNIDLHRLAENFPQIENLDLSAAPAIFLTDPFRTMHNMHVLKLENVALRSFEIIDGGCLPLLEELYVQLADEKDSLTRIESFPNFPKLTKLSLRLRKNRNYGVKWVDPKAFDHLK
jgi:hypothetical protein